MNCPSDRTPFAWLLGQRTPDSGQGPHTSKLSCGYWLCVSARIRMKGKPRFIFMTGTTGICWLWCHGTTLEHLQRWQMRIDCSLKHSSKRSPMVIDQAFRFSSLLLAALAFTGLVLAHAVQLWLAILTGMILTLTLLRAAGV